MYLLISKTATFGELFMDNALIGIAILIAFLLIAVLFAVTVSLTALKNEWDSIFWSKAVMLVKLLHIPAYIAIFILGVLFAITIFTFAISLVFVVLDLLLIATTGFMATTAAWRAYKEGKLSLKKAIFLSIFQYIYCIDVFASMYMYFYVEGKSIASEAKN